VQAALALGAEIHGREEALEWQPIGDGVRVRTNRGVYEADRLVITAGAWDSAHLNFLQGLAVPERQVLAWFQPPRPEYFRPDNFPVFNLLVDEGRFYGFPVHGVPGFKIGKYHHLEETGDPDRLDRQPYAYDEAVLRDLTARYFPDACGATMSLKSCLFTNTPDKHFIIDLHPTYPQVSFAAGFSGHGYKFASVIGEVLADLAQRGRSRHDIELFGLDRFGIGASHRADDRRWPDLGRAIGQRRRLESRRRMDRPRFLERQPVARSRDQLPAGRDWLDDYHSVLAEDDKDAIRPFW